MFEREGKMFEIFFGNDIRFSPPWGLLARSLLWYLLMGSFTSMFVRLVILMSVKHASLLSGEAEAEQNKI